MDDLLALAFDQAFFGDAWTIRSRDAFERCRESGRPRLGTVLLDTATLVGGILAEAHAIRTCLSKTGQKNWQSSVDDMRRQLDGLVFQGFLRVIAPDRLMHYPRYLKGIELRLDKLAGAAARDRQRMQEMTELHAAWWERQSQLDARHQADPRLDEIRWLLEELRISLFAQELKTPQPVSVKRIRRRWEALGL
jgi:ATP-dependent helicase HrpA